MRAPKRVRAVEAPLCRMAARAGWALADEKRGPAEAMGSRFDINGSIWLSDLLDSESSEHPPVEEIDTILDAAQSFKQRLEARIRSIRKQIRRRYANAFGGAEPLPGVPTMLKTLEATGARPKHNHKAAGRAAHAISGAHTKRFSRSLKTARAELVFLRDDLTPEIQRLGPAATELERIDAALSRALLVGARELTDRLTARVEESFEAALVTAASSLPEGGAANPEVVVAADAWLSESGWLRAHVRDTEALALALYDRDAELLTQLVDAATEIAAKGAVS